MRRIGIVVFFLALLSCQRNKQQSVPETAEQQEPVFFPVTSFLKGQVFTLKDKGINPLRYTTTTKRKDSAWLKVEEIDSAVKPFFTILIDTSNLKGLYKETNFLDESIDAYTFSYDPVKPLADTTKLRRWDVYVNPETNRVKRVYILLREDTATSLQLTWQTDKFCKMVWIDETSATPAVKKEVFINWDF